MSKDDIKDDKVKLNQGIELTEELLEHMFVERFLNMKIDAQTPVKKLIYKICLKMETLEKMITDDEKKKKENPILVLDKN